MSIVQIPSDPDVGRLATVRPAAVERVRRQMTGPLHPRTVERLLSDVQPEPITGEELLAIHRDGIQARIDGKSINSCPHTDDHRRWSWRDGWLTAFGADPDDIIEPPAPRFMTFNAGLGDCTITIVRAPLMSDEGSDEGQELVGRYVWRNRQIQISSVVPRTQRLEILAHECFHAYRFTHGQSYDEEIICDQFGAAGTMFFRQLLAQGGEAALMAMEPVDPDDAIEHDERFDMCQ